MDALKFEKEKAIARFNGLVTVRLRQFCQVMVVFGLFSWYSARLITIMLASSAYLFNHHVVFLLGNAIIVCLFKLCRQNGDVSIGEDFYDDYVKYSAHQRESSLPPSEDKQMVVCAEETTVNPQCENVLTAIETATKQIKRFRRIESEKLKREKARPELLRCETDNRRKEMENLSSEEFRRRIDAFIDAHWINNKSKRNQLRSNMPQVSSVS